MTRPSESFAVTVRHMLAGEVTGESHHHVTTLRGLKSILPTCTDTNQRVYRLVMSLRAALALGASRTKWGEYMIDRPDLQTFIEVTP